MKVYLAGVGTRPYVLQWTSTSQERTENLASSGKFIGGGKTDMDIYLAGGISGNLRPLWTKIADGGGAI